MDIPRVTHQFADVQGVRIFYRSAGPVDALALLLLHGFPSASHQFRRLFDALGTRYRAIARGLPGLWAHAGAPWLHLLLRPAGRRPGRLYRRPGCTGS